MISHTGTENVGNRPGSKKNMGRNLFVFRSKVTKGNDMAERDDEGVMGRSWGNVAESKHMVIAVDDVGGDAPLHDTAENAVGIRMFHKSPLLFNG